jgi:hypothetical protein
MTSWEEVADGVFRRRYQPHDVSVCVVRGTGGLLVCDTRSSHRQADEIRAERPMLAELIAAGEEPVEEWREIVITPPTVLAGHHRPTPGGAARGGTSWCPGTAPSLTRPSWPRSMGS